MNRTLKNDLLAVTVSCHGAELQGIENLRTRHQYLWQGDSAFWGRRSPVLFPIVGSVDSGVYRMDGREFRLGQHGFARDREFVPVDDCPDDELWFRLESDDATLALYPRRFVLEIGYRLEGERIAVMWRVTNTDDRVMHFQIGAHPAFNYPDFCAADPVHGYFSFSTTRLRSQVIREKGCVGPEIKIVETDAEGQMPITARTFADDALIFADSQTGRVSLLDKERRPYLTLLFASPLVGLWSPRPEAPFVCIEPWWGRCDSIGFSGDFSEREYVNTLQPGHTFEASYMIIIDNL